MSRLLPTVSVTTRHSVSAYPWQVQQQLPVAGPVIGVNRLSGDGLFAYDPWECYAAGIVTSPNMVVVGQLGTGKSALVKSYLSRQCLAGRSAFVLDPKGEYGPVADARGLARLALSPGGADRLNPLDPPGRHTAEHLARTRATLVAALAAAGLGRSLAAEERAAISAAVSELPTHPLLGDVVDRLLTPSTTMAGALHTDRRGLAAVLRSVALELRRLLAGDLAGMVDAASTVELDPDGPGLVLDLSAVFATDALAAVMVCAGTWLSTALATPAQRQRLLLVDEAWALLGGAATTRWLQSVSKLARRHGVQLITVVHRCSDLAGQADDGTAAQAQARGLLADAETRVVYAQAAGERAVSAELFGMTDTEADLVTRLPARRAVWFVGRHVAVVDHVLSERERDLVDTDQRMRS
jgi:type IV secretory pathway VirB4 component